MSVKHIVSSPHLTPRGWHVRVSSLYPIESSVLGLWRLYRQCFSFVSEPSHPCPCSGQRCIPTTARGMSRVSHQPRKETDHVYASFSRCGLIHCRQVSPLAWPCCHVAETTPDRWLLIAHRSPPFGIHAPSKVFCCSPFLNDTHCCLVYEASTSSVGGKPCEM